MTLCWAWVKNKTAEMCIVLGPFYLSPPFIVISFCGAHPELVVVANVQGLGSICLVTNLMIVMTFCWAQAGLVSLQI